MTMQKLFKRQLLLLVLGTLCTKMQASFASYFTEPVVASPSTIMQATLVGATIPLLILILGQDDFWKYLYRNKKDVEKESKRFDKYCTRTKKNINRYFKQKVLARKNLRISIKKLNDELVEIEYEVHEIFNKHMTKCLNANLLKQVEPTLEASCRKIISNKGYGHEQNKMLILQNIAIISASLYQNLEKIFESNLNKAQSEALNLSTSIDDEVVEEATTIYKNELEACIKETKKRLLNSLVETIIKKHLDVVLKNIEKQRSQR